MQVSFSDRLQTCDHSEQTNFLSPIRNVTRQSEMAIGVTHLWRMFHHHHSWYIHWRASSLHCSHRQWRHLANDGRTKCACVSLFLGAIVVVWLKSLVFYQQLPKYSNVNPKKVIQKFFWRILVEFVMLNNILKVYQNLTSGKGPFSRRRPRWVSLS